jgi:hypothetical protein
MARQLTGNVRITGTDDENWPETDERIDVTTPVSLTLDSDQPAVNLDIPHVRWGGECRVEVQVSARTVGDGAIQVEGEARLYEGNSENTTDLEDRKSLVFSVPRNTRSNTRAARHFVQLVNAGAGGGDHAEITFNFFNTIVEDE